MHTNQGTHLTPTFMAMPRASALLTLALLATPAFTPAQADTLNLKYTDLRRSLLAGSNNTVHALALNELGVSVGSVDKTTTYYDVGRRAWTTLTYPTPARWSATGTITALKLPSGTRVSGTARAINGSGVAAGDAAGQPAQWSSAGAYTRLDTRPGSAWALNDTGVVVGEVSVTDIVDGIVTDPEPRRATLWRNGQVQDLQSRLPATVIGSRAVAVNARGDVAVESVAPFAARSTGCYLLSDSQTVALNRAGQTGCAILGVADDGSALVMHETRQSCNPADAGCVRASITYALWQQGQGTDLTSPAMTLLKDGRVVQAPVATTTGAWSIATWQNGVTTRQTLNLVGLPTGTFVGQSILALNGKLQMLWQGVLDAGANPPSRTGLLTPQP
jgi:hypothetical protein